MALGHTRLAQLMGPGDIWSFEGRASGFRQAAAAAGATCIDIESSMRLPTRDAGIVMAEELLAGPGERPTGIFAHNDTIAIGAIGALRDGGLDCPSAVSIVGYNDVPLTDAIRPPLTTVRLPGYELGRLAAELVVTRIAGDEATTKAVVLAPELIVRNSTRRLESHQR